MNLDRKMNRILGDCLYARNCNGCPILKYNVKSKNPGKYATYPRSFGGNPDKAKIFIIAEALGEGAPENERKLPLKELRKKPKNVRKRYWENMLNRANWNIFRDLCAITLYGKQAENWTACKMMKKLEDKVYITEICKCVITKKAKKHKRKGIGECWKRYTKKEMEIITQRKKEKLLITAGRESTKRIYKSFRRNPPKLITKNKGKYSKPLKIRPAVIRKNMLIPMVHPDFWARTGYGPKLYGGENSYYRYGRRILLGKKVQKFIR